MGSSDIFCLKWNDFHKNISSSFQNLRDNQDFFDVTLISEDGNQIQAHKVILSACSEFFKAILRKNPHPNPLLYLKGISHYNLKSIIYFMYYGEANIIQENLDSFIAAAEDLQVRGLVFEKSQPKSETKNSSPTSTKSNFSPCKSPRLSKKTKNNDVRNIEEESVSDDEIVIINEPVISLKNEPQFEEYTKKIDHKLPNNDDVFIDENSFDEVVINENDVDNFNHVDDTLNSLNFLDDDDEDFQISTNERNIEKEMNKKINGKKQSSNKKGKITKNWKTNFNKNISLYICDGYDFLKDKEIGDKIYLRCRFAKTANCKSRCSINKKTKLCKISSPHSCNTKFTSNNLCSE